MYPQPSITAEQVEAAHQQYVGASQAARVLHDAIRLLRYNDPDRAAMERAHDVVVRERERLYREFWRLSTRRTDEVLFNLSCHTTAWALIHNPR